MATNLMDEYKTNENKLKLKKPPTINGNKIQRKAGSGNGGGGASNTAGQGATLGGGNNAPTKINPNTNKHSQIEGASQEGVAATAGAKRGIGRSGTGGVVDSSPLGNTLRGLNDRAVGSATKWKDRGVATSSSSPVVGESFSLGSQESKDPLSIPRFNQKVIDVPTESTMSDLNHTAFKGRDENGVLRYSDTAFEGGVGFTPEDRSSNLGSISASQIDANRQSLKELREYKQGFTDESLNGGRRNGRGDDGGVADARRADTLKMREKILKRLSSSGGKTRFGTETTVGGKNGIKNMLAAFNNEDQIASRAISDRNKNLTEQDRIANNLSLGQASNDIQADQIIASENRSIRDQLAASAEYTLKAAKDQESSQLGRDKLANSMRGTDAAVSKNQASIYSKLQMQEISTAGAIQSLVGSGMSASHILGSIPSMQKWAEKNPGKTSSENTPRGILNRYMSMQ